MAVEGLPDVLSVSIIFITDMVTSKFAVEGGLRGKLSLCESLPGVHMLVWVYTFAQQKLTPLLVGLIPSCDLEGLGRIGRHQLVKGG